jgi:hypothetical protein
MRVQNVNPRPSPPHKHGKMPLRVAALAFCPLCSVLLQPQIRQSAKRFSSRWNWDYPTPLAAGECAPPPFGPGGRAHSFAAKGVGHWGSPNSNEGTYTVVLYIYKYFVIAAHVLKFPLQ